MQNNNNNGLEPLIFDTPELRSKFIKNDDNTTTPNNYIKGMEFDVKTKSFEDKIYIILYKINSSEDEDIYQNIYSVCNGRTEAYRDIMDKLISGLDIDIHRSLIMTETKQTETQTGDRKYFMIPYNELISIYSFCVSVSDYYNNDDFDIEDYNDGDAPENNQLKNDKAFLTSDQLKYRQMLEESMQRNKFINNMRSELGLVDEHNI